VTKSQRRTRVERTNQCLGRRLTGKDARFSETAEGTRSHDPRLSIARISNHFPPQFRIRNTAIPKRKAEKSATMSMTVPFRGEKSAQFPPGPRLGFQTCFANRLPTWAVAMCHENSRLLTKSTVSSPAPAPVSIDRLDLVRVGPQRPDAGRPSLLPAPPGADASVRPGPMQWSGHPCASFDESPWYLSCLCLYNSNNSLSMDHS
jgi:hypothetical protein